jgi:hypothetical protein
LQTCRKKIWENLVEPLGAARQNHPGDDADANLLTFHRSPSGFHGRAALLARRPAVPGWLREQIESTRGRIGGDRRSSAAVDGVARAASS